MHPNSRTHHRGTGYNHWDMRVSSVPPNVEGKQIVLLCMLWQATRYSKEAFFKKSFSNSPNPIAKIWL
jgi:hypothetical protein